MYMQRLSARSVGLSIPVYPPLSCAIAMPGHYMHIAWCAAIDLEGLPVPIAGVPGDPTQGHSYFSVDLFLISILFRKPTTWVSNLPTYLSACVRGTMLICSTPGHNLDLYEVYYSPWTWLGPIIDHDWVYKGRVCEVFGLRRRPRGRAINTVAIENILGVYHEGYAFCNYDDEVTLYVRSCDGLPINLYEVQPLIFSVMSKSSIITIRPLVDHPNLHNSNSMWNPRWQLYQIYSLPAVISPCAVSMTLRNLHQLQCSSY